MRAAGLKLAWALGVAVLSCFHAVGAAAAEPQPADRACEVLVRAAEKVSLAGRPLNGRYACEPAKAHGARQRQVLALRYRGPEVQEGGSNLVGYFAVDTARGTVHDWDFANDRLGGLRYRAASSPEPACTEAAVATQAELFFKQHQAFYARETPALRQAVSPALYSALQRHYRCEGVCHLDYDPWLGAQDGEIAAPVRFAVSSSTRQKAEVAMRYRYDAGPGQAGQTNTVRLRFSAVAAPRCWVLTDLVTPLGDSLLQRYRGKP